MSSMKSLLVPFAALASATIVCPFCELAVSRAAGQGAAVAAQVTDSATVRMHISGMTCGTCPVTARVALKKLSGVYEATVTLDDSLGVVRYDPRRVAPAQIAAHLTRLTGFKATLMPDSARTGRGTR